MKALALLALPVALLATTASAASTDTPTIPAKDFPTGANINFVASLDNAGYDTTWGTTGPGDPGFHSLTADSMGRTGGWGEEAVLAKAQHGQDFVIFVSTFDSADHAQAAALDMATTVANYGLTAKDTAMAAVTGSTADNTAVLKATTSRWTLYGVTVVQGTSEVEALVKFRTHHGDGPTDKTDLVQAVNDALAATSGSGS
jgi:hypothetical protein